MSSPVFSAAAIYAPPLRFQAYTDPSGMGNEQWSDVDNPLYDSGNPFISVIDGSPLGPKDFPGFVPDVNQPLSQSLARGGTNEATQAGSLYGPREYVGIVQGDWRFSHGGIYYHIIGDPEFDHLHPLTGENFGYVQWTVRKGG